MRSYNFKFWRFKVYLTKVVDFCDETLKWVPAFPWWYIKIGRILNKPSRISFAWSIVPFSYSFEICFWKDSKKMNERYQ